VAGSIGDPSSTNRYSYVGCDPVNFVDPNGLKRNFFGCAAGIVAVGVGFSQTVKGIFDAAVAPHPLLKVGGAVEATIGLGLVGGGAHVAGNNCFD
jgi:hypothetical protein